MKEDPFIMGIAKKHFGGKGCNCELWPFEHEHGQNCDDLAKNLRRNSIQANVSCGILILCYIAMFAMVVWKQGWGW